MRLDLKRILSISFFTIAAAFLCSLFLFGPTHGFIVFWPTDFKSAFLMISSWTAFTLFSIFGLSAYIIPVFLTWLSIINFKRKPLIKEISRIFGFLLCFFFLSILGLIFFGMAYAGLLGLYGYKILSFFFDYFLIKFISICSVWIGFILVFQFAYLAPVKFLVRVFNQKLLAKTWLHLKAACKLVYSMFIDSAIWVKKCFTGQVIEELEDSLYTFEYDQFAQEDSKVEDFWLLPEQENEEINSFESDSLPDLTLEEEVPTQKPEDIRIKRSKKYKLPNPNIFTEVKDVELEKEFDKELKLMAKILEEKLERFGVEGKVVSIEYGPVITLFQYDPDPDCKISKIVALEDDLALALEATSIRIIAPIPGKSVVGFEISNRHRKDVLFSSVARSKEFESLKSHLPLVLGEDTIGRKMIADLTNMPHLLIAGSTGSGKSVALNSMLVSLLCKCSPDQLRLILIDPKRLEFSSYADIPHLLFPIITQPRYAIAVLKWVVQEMESRYERMAECSARNIFDYNNYCQANNLKELPFIVVVIDELADLMMTAGKDVEEQITRIAQMARASGIHLIVATQRPSVDVITGLIKVNFPSRISFRVSSKADSKTILDGSGAEKLLGKGDMLFMDPKSTRLQRIHGAYVSDDEINQVVAHVCAERAVEYLDLQELIVSAKKDSFEDDEIYDDVVEFVSCIDEVSISLLQRKFKIGYNRSARLIDQLECQGLILPADGGRLRKVIKRN